MGDENYIVTFEDGPQSLFKTLGDASEGLGVRYATLEKRVADGKPWTVHSTGRRFWIELLARSGARDDS